MEIGDYTRILRRGWKIIVGCVIAGVALAGLMTMAVTPQYSSTVRMFVSTAPSDTVDAYQGSLFSEQRVLSYADLAGGRTLARQVIDDLGLKTTPAQLASRITTTAVPQTVILEIAAQDPDPRMARLIAQSTAQNLARLVDQLESARSRQAPIEATIVDRANLPTSPVSPNVMLNLGVGAVIGLFLGVALAVLRERLDTAVRTKEDIATFSEAAVMGHIGYDGNARRTPLVTPLDPQSPRSEAFRVLRTNLQFVDVDNRGSRVFVVTSALPEEGKTTTAANLAIVLAQAGQTVLLMEADMRRPKLTDLMTLEPEVGLSTVLAGRVTMVDAIQEYAPVPKLWVLTSGTIPPNPAELLQSHTMSELLEHARMTFDVVIVDAPPLLPVTDAAVLAAASDGALIVVRHGKTSKEQLRHSMDRLDAVHGRTLGVVLNMVPRLHKTGYGQELTRAPERRERRPALVPEPRTSREDEFPPRQRTGSPSTDRRERSPSGERAPNGERRPAGNRGPDGERAPAGKGAPTDQKDSSNVNEIAFWRD